nr:MAG TPA: hypothetical protein [Caudoviricetes sp.]
MPLGRCFEATKKSPRVAPQGEKKTSEKIRILF